MLIVSVHVIEDIGHIFCPMPSSVTKKIKGAENIFSISRGANNY